MSCTHVGAEMGKIYSYYLYLDEAKRNLFLLCVGGGVRACRCVLDMMLYKRAKGSPFPFTMFSLDFGTWTPVLMGIGVLLTLEAQSGTWCVPERSWKQLESPQGLA